MPQTYKFANLVSAETALAGKIKTRRCHTSSRGPQHCCRFSRGANRSAALSFYKSITLGYIIVSTITYVVDVTNTTTAVGIARNHRCWLPPLLVKKNYCRIISHIYCRISLRNPHTRVSKIHHHPVCHSDRMAQFFTQR